MIGTIYQPDDAALVTFDAGEDIALRALPYRFTWAY